MTFGFKHTTSSTCFLGSNGEGERAVQRVKESETYLATDRRLLNSISLHLNCLWEGSFGRQFQCYELVPPWKKYLEEYRTVEKDIKA
ncbi:unnamed protein product [Clavelina lepadiformis]|uniref:Uncharacterized protein n=1 Tax=Clavelina lepadiformis TaxID=159417 RepID=A0ABP0GWN0_CLALP